MVLDSLPARLSVIVLLTLVVIYLRCVQHALTHVSEAKLIKHAGEEAKEKISLLFSRAKQINDTVRKLILTAEIAVAVVVACYPPEWVASPALRIVIGELILLLVLSCFGIYFPRRITIRYSERIVLANASIMLGLRWLLFPISAVLKKLSDLVAFFFGIHPNDVEDEVTEDEIRMLVDVGSQSGAIDPEEKEMIHNIFELDDTQIYDIMTHRTDIEILWSAESVEEWETKISETNHSIYPVCGESVDDIVGVLNSRDFYRMLRNNSVTDVQEILRAPTFVPETVKADDLFRQMQQTKNHFVVVLDEYGGLSGIITMSDLLEEIVGTLANEYDETEEEEIVPLGENRWRLLGSADLEQVAEELKLELPCEEYNTFAGLVLAELGSIPEDGTTLSFEAYGMQIDVLRIEEHRIEEVEVLLLNQKAEAEETETDENIVRAES